MIIYFVRRVRLALRDGATFELLDVSHNLLQLSAQLHQAVVQPVDRCARVGVHGQGRVG